MQELSARVVSGASCTLSFHDGITTVNIALNTHLAHWLSSLSTKEGGFHYRTSIHLSQCDIKSGQ